MNNLYETLGVPNTATPTEIKIAFKTIAQYAHPDKDPEGEHTELFEEVVKAISILGDPQKRATYDLTGAILDGSESLAAIATDRVARLISSCYVSMCNGNQCKQNIVDFAINSLQLDVNKVNSRIAQLAEYKIRLANEMLGRVTVPEDMLNICENVCKQKIKELDASLVQGEEELVMLDSMRTILEHYTDSFGPRRVATEFHIASADPATYKEET